MAKRFGQVVVLLARPGRPAPHSVRSPRLELELSMTGRPVADPIDETMMTQFGALLPPHCMCADPAAFRSRVASHFQAWYVCLGLDVGYCHG
jgi:hypothetical protein